VHQIKVPTYGARTTVTVNSRLVWDGMRAFAYGAHVENGYVVLTGAPARASISSQAVGSVPTNLGVAVTSSVGVPVRAGQSIAIPVTVRASGDRVVSGSVTATVPSGWNVTPASFSLDTRDGPTDTVVDVVVSAPAGASGGTEPISLTASSGTVSASTTAHLLVFGNWPAGTSASASSEHAPNTFNGQVRTYYAANAIDGNLATFWNDDTPAQFPDTLEITTPSAVTLHGVGFASIIDGVPTDFAVQTWDGSQWVTQASVTGNSALQRWIPFASPVTTTQVRVVVTASQIQNGNFTRIAELTP
jgi:hypothetical protein